MRSATFSPLSTDRPVTTTFAPSAANISAMVRPMPRVDPLMNATLPSSLMGASCRSDSAARQPVPTGRAPGSLAPVELQDARVLVVGASSGIGRAVAEQLVAGGARVVFAARRADKLADAAAAGRRAGRYRGVRRAACPSTATRVVRDAVEQLGGLDVVVYATAIDPLVRLIDTDADRWHDVFATNVVGASLVCRAALAPLTDSHGRMVYISASSVGRPLPGMGAYETSKAALDELVRAWRGEHPEIGFCNVAVGNTLGTEVYESWDRDAAR